MIVGYGGMDVAEDCRGARVGGPTPLSPAAWQPSGPSPGPALPPLPLPGAAELLLLQEHYDWGLRAVKSVLVIAGELKRGDPAIDERRTLMRALRDTNMAKLSRDDIYVFMKVRCAAQRLVLREGDIVPRPHPRSGVQCLCTPSVPQCQLLLRLHRVLLLMGWALRIECSVPSPTNTRRCSSVTHGRS